MYLVMLFDPGIFFAGGLCALLAIGKLPDVFRLFFAVGAYHIPRDTSACFIGSFNWFCRALRVFTMFAPLFPTLLRTGGASVTTLAHIALRHVFFGLFSHCRRSSLGSIISGFLFCRRHYFVLLRVFEISDRMYGVTPDKNAEEFPLGITDCRRETGLTRLEIVTIEQIIDA